MNKKQILEKYYKHLFNASQTYKEDMFLSCNKNIDNQWLKSDRLLIVSLAKKIKPKDTEISPSYMALLKTENLKLDLNNYDGFFHFINSSPEKQKLFFDNPSQACKIQMPENGVSNPTNENALVLKLNIEVLTCLLKDTNNKEQEYIASNIHHFLIEPYNTEFSSIITILKQMKLLGHQSFSDAALSHVSTKLADINTYRIAEIFPKIVNALKDYKGNDDIDAELRSLICKRAFQVKKSKSNELLLRNILLDYYQQNEELLKPYAPHFKSVREYLYNLSADENVLVEDKVFVQSIDFIKFKATVTKNWSTIEYKSILEKFCKVYEAKEDRIKKINYSILKLGKGVEHFMLYISLDNNKENNLTLDDVKKTMSNFVKELKSSDEKQVLKLDYISKWFEQEKLNNSLQKKADVTIKRNKI